MSTRYIDPAFITRADLEAQADVVAVECNLFWRVRLIAAEIREGITASINPEALNFRP